MARNNQDQQKSTEESDISFYKSMDIMAGSPQLARSVIEECIAMDTPVGIFGRAGIGKTQIVQQIARDLDMDLVVLYLAHMDKEDLAGFPFPDTEDENAVVMRLKKMLPREKSKRNGTILFLDEWNRGERPVVNAMFTIMEKPRRAGDLELPSDVRIVLSGNPSDAQYTVNEAEKEPAIRRRVQWLGVVCSPTAWVEYAVKANFHPAVVNYVKKHKAALYDTEAHNAGKVAACPASWEKVSSVIKHFDAKYKGDYSAKDAALRAMISGHIGTRLMSDFMTELVNTDAQSIDPEEVLHDFRPGTEAHDRVSKLVKSKSAGASGKIGDLCSAIALTVAATQPTPMSVAPNIAEFMLLLEGDTFQSFCEALVRTLSEHDQSKTYTALFNKTLAQQNAYIEARKRLTQRMAAMDKKMKE